ncbi:hypothetical protein GOBAR_DD27800 [Gossypium barbadense]|nr:hypothetical protein GOBAR_DD27800 [Gossypium barbadense]
MACFHSMNLRTPCLWTSLPCIRRHFSRNLKDGNKLLSFNRLYVIRPSPFQTLKQYCSLSGNLSSTVPGDHAIPHGNAVISSKKEQIFHQEAALGRANLQETVVNAKSSNGRVMLIDGTSVIYRAYYKLLGLNFRHTLFPSYKSNRPPTPDTIVQGLQYLKASIKAMSIKVIEVPGVEADDVIGTLAARSVDEGFKVRVVSPDKDFFQILCPSLRLLRIAPRGYERLSNLAIIFDVCVPLLM